MTAHGPYATREQALADAKPVYTELRAVNPGGAMTEQIRTARHAVRVTAIDNTLNACGVELGAYDGDIVDWLATWEPETVQVILGWVERSHAAGCGEFDAAIADANARIDALTIAARRAAPVEVDLAGFRRLIAEDGTQ